MVQQLGAGKRGEQLLHRPQQDKRFYGYIDALTVMAILDLLIGERVIVGGKEIRGYTYLLISNDKCHWTFCSYSRNDPKMRMKLFNCNKEHSLSTESTQLSRTYVTHHRYQD